MRLSLRRCACFTPIFLILAACVGAPPPAPAGQVAVRPAALPPVPAPRPATLPTSRPAPAPAAPAADPGFARPPAGLEDAIHGLWREFPGRTGIAIQRIDGDWTLARRGDDLFPQQSVSKLWVAMAALDAVDRGRVRMEDRVRIGPDDLTLFSQPIAARVRAEGAAELTVAEMIDIAVTRSDNTVNDSLTRHIGGPAAVNSFLRAKRLGAIRFGPGERALQSRIAGMRWDQSMSAPNGFEAARARVPLAEREAAMAAYLADPADGATPNAVAAALARLARGDLLSAPSTKFLLDTLEATRTGPTRIKAGLPAGWRFGHKTGTGQNLNGMTAGYNNIGIATAPDGTRYAIVVFLRDTTAPVPARMRMMQAVARELASRHGT